jgi:hypothetical protein
MPPQYELGIPEDAQSQHLLVPILDSNGNKILNGGRRQRDFILKPSPFAAAAR